MGADNRAITYITQMTLDVLNQALSEHPIYSGDVRAYNKYAMKERPQAGVELSNVTVDSNKLSPDDYMNVMHSYLALGRVASSPGNSAEWVWENESRVTPYFEKEDVTQYLDIGGLIINLPSYITAGRGIRGPASSIHDVQVFVNGQRVLPAFVDGEHGRVVLNTAVRSGEKVEMSYYCDGLDKEGVYFIEMLTDDTFAVTPMYIVSDELVKVRATGTELELNLPITRILSNPFTLYTKMRVSSYKNNLVAGVDFALDTEAGKIILLNPLPVGASVYASYRYQGEDRGPFKIDGDYSVNYDAISGATIAFGEKRHAGDKFVVVLKHKRTRTAFVFGNTHVSNMDIKVFSRDPISSAEIADHLRSHIYGVKRDALMNEGYIVDTFTHSGSGDESYQDSVQDIYFTNSLTLSVITEFKRYDPIIVDITGVNANISLQPQEVVTLYDRNGVSQNYELRDGSSLFVAPRMSGPRIY